MANVSGGIPHMDPRMNPSTTMASQPEVPAAFTELTAASDRLLATLGELASRLTSVVHAVPSRGTPEGKTVGARVPLAEGIYYQADRLNNMTAEVQTLLDGLQL